MEVIDEQTQEDDEGEGSGEEEEDEEDEDEKPAKKAPAKKAPKRKATPSGSEGSEGGSDEDSEEEKAPSDGGGSDYEPDEPVKINRGDNISNPHNQLCERRCRILEGKMLCIFSIDRSRQASKEEQSEVPIRQRQQRGGVGGQEGFGEEGEEEGERQQ